MASFRISQHEKLRAAGRFSCGNGTKRADRRRYAARSVARVCVLTAFGEPYRVPWL
jgi:hypothetical protein